MFLVKRASFEDFLDRICFGLKREVGGVESFGKFLGVFGYFLALVLVVFEELWWFYLQVKK